MAGPNEARRKRGAWGVFFAVASLGWSLAIGGSPGCSRTAQLGETQRGGAPGGTQQATGGAGGFGGGGRAGASGQGGSPRATGGTMETVDSGTNGGGAGSGLPAAGGSGGAGADGSGGPSIGGGSSGGGAAGAGRGPLTNRAGSIAVGIENVNDSPLKAATYRALLRFVPDTTLAIDRMYFGFKLRGASCWDSGIAGYGAGDGGTLHASLVNIDPGTGLPSTEIASETVNGCARHNEAAQLVGADPVMVWVNTKASLDAGKLYALIVSNTHADPTGNFFSFNMPLADTALAGPHARNELDQNAAGGILGLDPREHVAWSKDGGKTWDYGSLNGQYRSYMNDNDTAHPATRMPQFGFRLTSGKMLAVQPYYAYSDDCTGCAVTYANARFARTFAELGAFTASGTDVGTLTITNESTGAHASCTPAQGYGFRRCTLPAAVPIAAGASYTVACTGSVEIMKLDNPQRIMFPGVGTSTGEIRMFQRTAAAGSNAKDVPNLWAGPLSAGFPTPGDP